MLHRIIGVIITFFFGGRVFVGFSQPQRPHRDQHGLRIQLPSPRHVVFDFCPLMSCVCSPFKCAVHIMGKKPHAVLWGVSTNIHAVKKRVAGNAAVNMSRVIIRAVLLIKIKSHKFKGDLKTLKGKAIY